MTQRQPEARWGADEYLREWPKQVFPASFWTLHGLLQPLMGWSKERAVLHMQASLGGALQSAASEWQRQAEASGNVDAAADGAEGAAGEEQLRADGGKGGSSGGSSAASKPASQAGHDRQQQASGGMQGAADAASDAARTGPDASLQGKPVNAGAAEEQGKALEHAPGCADAAAGQLAEAEQVATAAADSWAERGARFVRQALAKERNAEALDLVAAVVCALLRGAATQEGRWATVRLLLALGDLCDDHCRLEWVIPYLLNYIVSERGASPGEDTVPRAIALSRLPALFAKLRGLPRSERSLFIGYVMPALGALPERQSALLRAQAAQSLAAVARAAQALQERAVDAALRDGAPPPRLALLVAFEHEYRSVHQHWVRCVAHQGTSTSSPDVQDATVQRSN
jgi:hypothetical protein